ncbi:hypothetical protein [Blastococcus sp. CT_GayMR16]|uniref:hypothetical protein n=1 Tax=Blastococcus sp. CT_GayMR16 TaxID=2559607 RepID=UPI001073B9EC|nr:hypothetical protein [Blastococcus sp. CT_GayMR16]TFV90402.1 hypothetical protein E4P38_02885 [Blastococcus sp. CT_GayMR16]
MTPRKPAVRHRAGPVERRIKAELKAAGWTATSVGPASSIAAIAVDLAQTQDRTTAARDKAALARELRIQLQTFRGLSEPSKGDAVDEAADELSGGAAGAADPDRVGDGNVRPFGRRRPAAG